MPKVRLRPAPSGETYRLELPPGCTLECFKEEARKALGLAAGTDVVMSLNKKTALCGEPNDTMEKLGICSGDLVWLLSPAVGAATPAAAAATVAAAPAVPQTAPKPSTTLQSSASRPTASLAASASSRTGASTLADGRSRYTAAAAAPAAATPSSVTAAGGVGNGDVAMAEVQQDGPQALPPGQQPQGGQPEQQGQQGQHGGGELGDGEVEEDGELGELTEDEQAASLVPPGVSLRLGRLLLQLATSHSPPTPHQQQPTAAAETTVAAAAGGAVGSEGAAAAAGGTGAVPAAATPLPAASRALLVVDCAMAEAGFRSLQDVAAALSRPHVCPTAVLPRQLSYACTYVQAEQQQQQPEGAGASAAVPPASGGSGSGGSAADGHIGGDGGTGAGSGDTDVTMADAAAAVPQAQGEHQPATGGQPSVQLLWYPMGRHLVLHGRVLLQGAGGGGDAGGATVREGGAPAAAAAAASTAASRSSAAGSSSSSSSLVATLNIDLSLYDTGATPPPHTPNSTTTTTSGSEAAAENQGSSGASTESHPQHPHPHQTLAALLPRDMPAQWRRLLDGLCLPLLAAACRTAGVAPPLGLGALPLELQMDVLGRLPPRALALLSCTTVALHRLASEDSLWRALYDKEFLVGGAPATAAAAGAVPRAPPAADVALAQARGWKHVFGVRWREREERRRQRQRFMPQPPPWMPNMPWAPARRPPFMPPFAIGGDYDRLPGPLLGMGPGMFGGGGRGMWAGGRAGLGPRMWGGGGGTGGFRI